MKKKKFFSSEKVKCSDLLQTLKQHRGLVGAYYTNIFLQNSQRFGSNRFPQLQIFFDSRTVLEGLAGGLEGLTRRLEGLAGGLD